MLTQLDEEAIFQTARLITDPAARGQYLGQACGNHDSLRRRVEMLLQADATNDSFLKSNEPDHANPVGRGSPNPAPSPDRRSPNPADNSKSQITFPPSIIERVGLKVGRYKLLEQIGEGGMGTVWVAEQTEPVKRRVALKLIKPGMDSRQVLSRFEAERQALALMDHPNIAKVYDGGMTEEGRPFFVMEYVRGVPITEYCDSVRLSIQDRLKLFIPVCQAVHHAHQKGIIHRDLKPSNILVCLYDGQPVPKVIDFGLAKAMHQPLTEHTLYTAHGLMVGTPLYMSPEQAEFNNLDVDTRSDIYSLGVILYELLTGTTPLEKCQFKDAAFQEILRLIKDVEPQRPSLKISSLSRVGQARAASAGPLTALNQPTLASIAAQRSLEPSQLSRTVRGDLDWIVMKSLEKERARRYETANNLARDIERYLHDEPVDARPPSAWYRLQKFNRRNRVAVFVTLFVAASLFALLFNYLLGLRTIRRERDRALAAERNAIDAADTARQAQQAEAELRREAESQREKTTAQLYHSLLNEANALRLGRQPGYRRVAWNRIEQAGSLPTTEKSQNVLRDAATCCLGDYIGEGPIVIDGFKQPIRIVVSDAAATKIAVGLLDGSVSLRDADTGTELAFFLNKKSARENSTFQICFNEKDDSLVIAHDDEVKFWNRTRNKEWASKTVLVDGVVSQLVSLPGGEIIALSMPIDKSDAGPRGMLKQRVLSRIADGRVTSEILYNAPANIGNAEFLPLCEQLHISYLVAGRKRDCLWFDNTGSDTPVRKLTLEDSGRAKISADGKRMLLSGSGGGAAGTITFYETEQGKALGTIQDQVILAAAISPDSTLVAYAPGQLNLIKLWNTTVNRQMAGLKCPSQPTLISFSPDGRTLLASNVSSVCVWRMDAAEKRLYLGHGRLPVATAFSPAGADLVSVGHDATVRIWDVRTGNLKRILSLPSSGQHVCYSPDGKFLACCGENFLRLWDTENWENTTDLNVPADLFSKIDNGTLWTIAFSPNGRYLAAGGMGLGLGTITLTDGKLSVEQFSRLTDRYLRHACFSSDSSRLLWVEGFSSRATLDVRNAYGGNLVILRVWDVDQSREMPRVPAKVFSSVESASFFSDSKRVVLFNQDRKPEVWNIITANKEFDFHNSFGEDLSSISYNSHSALSPDNRWLASDTMNSRGVHLWNVNERKRVFTLPEEESTVTWLSWSPDSNLLSVSRSDMTVAVWRMDQIRQDLDKIGLAW